MTRVDDDDFHAGYAAALRTYLEARGEEDLAVGHELGRRALQEGISMLDIIENHFQLVDDLAQRSGLRSDRRPWASCCRRWPHSMSRPADSSTAQSVTRSSGPAPKILPIATSSAAPW